MTLRSLFILAAVTIAMLFVAPVAAAPLAQADVEEVVVTSTSVFTLTVRIDEVTTVAIPMQVEWRAEGPTVVGSDEMLVSVSPTVLQTGFFSVTVGAVEPTTGNLAITLVEPAVEVVPIAGTETTTATTTTTATATATATTTVSVPDANAPTTNAISNLRAGPGTDYAIVGSLEAGAALDLVGQTGDGTWFTLANGSWIAAFLINNPPTGLPIIEPATLPLPTPTQTNILTPTAIPTVTPTP